MADNSGMPAPEPRDASSEASTAWPTIDINYIKSNHFREVACDGVLGGPTPNGKLWLSFYTERLPLPRIVRYGLVRTGHDKEFSVDPSSPGMPLETREGIVRNVEIGLYLSRETAVQLRDWLDRHIDSPQGNAP